MNSSVDASELARIVELDARLEMNIWTLSGSANCTSSGCSVGVKASTQL